jgi:thiol-disulfide isomerase/thioredoxin
MKLSRRTALTCLSLAILLVAGVLWIKLGAAQEDDAVAPLTESSVTPAAAETTTPSEAAATSETETAPAASAKDTGPTDPRFAVPEGTNAKKLAFLDRLTQPATQFTSMAEANKYWGQAAAAMKIGGEQILVAKPTPDEASQAVQFKAEALRIMAMLGDKNADAERTKFLDASLKDPRFEVSSVVGPLRMLPKMRRWGELSAADRTAAIDAFTADVKAAGPTPGQAQLLLGFADDLGNSPEPLDNKLAGRAVEELLPTFKKGFANSSEPALKDVLATIEGLGRRLNLVGNKLELEGNLMDGKPLDWESYRGKVVLVDFWASWCPECLKEVPNVLDAYSEYHDKGFEVVGICLDNDRRLAEQAIRQTGMTWPQVYSEEPVGNGWAHPLQLKYAVIGIPRAILVDQDGKVVTMLARGRLLDQHLQKLLGPGKEGAASSGPDVSTSQTPGAVSR